MHQKYLKISIAFLLFLLFVIGCNEIWAGGIPPELEKEVNAINL